MYPYGPRPPRLPAPMPFQQRPMGFHSSFMPMRTPMQSPNPQPRGLGGLLAKIFRRGNEANFQGMGFPGGREMFRPGIPTSFGGPVSGQGATGLGSIMNNFSSGGITGMLNNVQRVMGLAQQVGPMIQQYGPFIKNMPAMFKIMKQLNNASSDPDTDSDSDSGSDTTDEINPTTEGAANEKESPILYKVKDDDFDDLDYMIEDKARKKSSKPKLYI